MLLPTVPTFTSVAPTVAQLNQLSYAAMYLADQDVRPTFTLIRIHTSGGQTSSANAWNVLDIDTVVYDNDGGANVGANEYVIQTQGYWAFENCIQANSVAGAGQLFAPAFKITGGGNNPILGGGSTRYFGFRGCAISDHTVAASDNANTCSAMAPFTLYSGDIIQAVVFTSTSQTIDSNTNNSYIQGRFVAKFSGYWVRTGP